MEAWLSYVLLLYLLFTVRLHLSRLCTKANFAVFVPRQASLLVWRLLLLYVVSKQKGHSSHGSVNPSEFMMMTSLHFLFESGITAPCRSGIRISCPPGTSGLLIVPHNVLFTYAWNVVQMYGMRVRILAQVCSSSAFCFCMHRTLLEVHCLRTAVVVIRSMCVASHLCKALFTTVD